MQDAKKRNISEKSINANSDRKISSLYGWRDNQTLVSHRLMKVEVRGQVLASRALAHGKDRSKDMAITWSVFPLYLLNLSSRGFSEDH